MTELTIEDDVAADDPSEESEDDLHSDQDALQQAVVTGTDWTTETLLNQLRRGNIELNPSFQRRDAWTLDRKSRFVESLILGLPVPKLVLAERKERRGTYIVIDGKQRILSLSQFAGQGDSPASSFKLRGLTSRVDLNGVNFSKLQSEPTLIDELSAFDNSTIRTVVIRNWPTEDVLYMIFLRLNTGSVPLSPQELRQALHPGHFVTFADEFSFDSRPIQRALNLSRPDFRMRDVELTVRFFGFKNFLSDYAGDLKRFLDQTCLRLNAAWEAREDELRRQAAALNDAIEATYQIFGVNSFRRYTGAHRYERQFNRAVFDLMTYHFSENDIAQDAIAHKEEVRAAFERISSEDENFSTATQATTKSLSATYTRLKTWTRALNAILDINMGDVRLENGRIVYGV